VGHRAGLEGCGKSRPHRDSIPGPFNTYRVAIPTELSRPTRNLFIITFAEFNVIYTGYTQKNGAVS
jgi:hypothetical protein